MMSTKLNLRLRSSTKGVQNLQSIESSITFNEFKTIIETMCGISANSQKVSFGYPPKAINASGSESINSLGITSGETITVDEVAPSAYQKQPEKPVEQHSQPTSTMKPPEPRPDPSIPVGSVSHEADTIFVRRVVDADNSCLFNSVGYVLEGRSRTKAYELRNLIAQTVLSRPELYNEAVLGRTTQDYATWIKKSESWGGAIELSILSQYYRTEIAAFDTQTLRMDLYGESAGYKQRVYLIYDGIHYDPMALTFGKDLPEDMDITVFQPGDSFAVAKALEVATEANKMRKFTDTSSFTLRCLVCQKGFKGEKEGIEHAKQTGHQNFSEY